MEKHKVINEYNPNEILSAGTLVLPEIEALRYLIQEQKEKIATLELQVDLAVLTLGLIRDKWYCFDKKLIDGALSKIEYFKDRIAAMELKND